MWLRGLREIFGLTRTLETLYLAFSSSGLLMRILGSIVAPSTTLMSSCDSKDHWLRQHKISDRP
jgi:hypothetical protein